MVNMIKTTIPCICAVLFMATLAQAKGWRGIVPLRSTRTDVERLLGAPKESRGVASTYDTENEKVLVFYSSGPCRKDASAGWNVPRDVVISFTISPKSKIPLTDLKLDRTKYKRERDLHASLGVYYINEEEGIIITTRTLEDGEDVYSITYEPSATDNYLRCPGSKVQQPCNKTSSKP